MPNRERLFTSALACKIVGLDRLRFNDAVANRLYPCAPAAIKGSTRRFTAEQLIPLYFFARLTEFGIPAGRAGHLACEAASAARSRGHEDADRLILLRSEHTETFVGSTVKVPSTGEVRHYDPQHEQNGRHYPGLGRVIFAIEFYFSHVRQIINDRIEDELRVYGEEDEPEAG